MKEKILKKILDISMLSSDVPPTYGIHIQHYDTEILLIELKRPYLFTCVQIFSMCKLSILPLLKYTSFFQRFCYIMQRDALIGTNYVKKRSIHGAVKCLHKCVLFFCRFFF